MKKKIYYTIEKETDDTGESLTGNKNITVYEILDNEPKQLFTLDEDNGINSKKAIQAYLNDNGMGDDEFEMILL